MSAADRIAETILRMGQIRAQGLQQSADAQARAQAANGQIWGGAIAQLGQLPGEIAKYKLADTENQVRQQQLATQKRYAQGEQDANWIYQGLMKPGPDGTVNIDESTLPKLQAGMANAGVPLEVQDRTVNSLKSVMDANTSFRQSQLDHQVKIAKAVLAGVTPDHPLTPGSALATLKMAQTNGIANAHDVDQFMAAMNQGHDPADLFKAIIQYGTQQKPITNETELALAASGGNPQAAMGLLKPGPKAEQPKGITNETELELAAADPNHPQNAAAKAALAARPAKPEAKAPNVGTFEDYVTRTYGPTPTPAQILQARKDYGQADDRPRVNVNVPSQELADVKESVKGMVDGTIPPQLPGRNTKEYTAVTAEAHRQGYDLVKAIQDWTATQKYLSTLNGPQQLKLRQSITALPDLLDSVDTLADKWKAGRFPALNAANLALAKNGAYGNEAATIANSLSTQISDVRADLASIYMGGNSPTDDAFKLAETSLNQNWDNKVLHDMTNLARKNVQIRNNSIKTTGPAGTSEGNPYAPKPPAQTAPPAAAPSSLDALKAKRKALGLE